MEKSAADTGSWFLRSPGRISLLSHESSLSFFRECVSSGKVSSILKPTFLFFILFTEGAQSIL